MRKITEIIIHCTATRQGHAVSVADIDRCHRQRGFKCIGYHFVVHADGTVEKGRPVEQTGAHCLGHNKHSIGIAYVGGLDCNGRPADTRTPQQTAALKRFVEQWQAAIPGITVHGHNEFAAKACPCFDVRSEFPRQTKSGKLRAGALAALLATGAGILSGCHSSKNESKIFAQQSAQQTVSTVETAGTRAHASVSSLNLEIDSLFMTLASRALASDSVNVPNQERSAIIFAKGIRLGRNTDSMAISRDSVSTAEVNTAENITHVKNDKRQKRRSMRGSLLLIAVTATALLLCLRHIYPVKPRQK